MRCDMCPVVLLLDDERYEGGSEDEGHSSWGKGQIDYSVE
jgi:hypothetical protein